MSIDRDLGRSVVEASGLDLRPSGQGGPQSGRDLGMVKGGSGMEGSSRWRLTSGKLDVVEAPGWTLGVMDFSEKVLVRWDTCQHHDEGQILNTTDALIFSLIEVCGREVGEA